MKEITKLRLKAPFMKDFWVWHWNDFKTNMKKSPRQNGAENNPEGVIQIFLIMMGILIVLFAILFTLVVLL